MSGRSASGSDRSMQLDVTILGREFKVACKEGERVELAEAVAFLDRRMREIRDAGKIAGLDRIAVMAALNIAHEFLRERRTAGAKPNGDTVDADAAQRRIRSMQSAIDQLMAGQDKLF